MDKLSDELKLFRHRKDLTSPCWQERLQKWLIHFAIYGEIKGNGSTAQEIAVQIDAVTQHLTILDAKFALALTFNSLLFAAVALMLNRLPEIVRATTRHNEQVAVWIFILFCIAAAGLCLGNMWMCIRGIERIYWGELGQRAHRPNKGATNEVIEVDKDDASLEYRKFFLLAIARRTNRFRIAMASTKAALGVTIVLFALTVLFVFYGAARFASPHLLSTFH